MEPNSASLHITKPHGEGLDVRTRIVLCGRALPNNWQLMRRRAGFSRESLGGRYWAKPRRGPGTESRPVGAHPRASCRGARRSHAEVAHRVPPAARGGVDAACAAADGSDGAGHRPSLRRLFALLASLQGGRRRDAGPDAGAGAGEWALSETGQHRSVAAVGPGTSPARGRDQHVPTATFAWACGRRKARRRDVVAYQRGCAHTVRT